MYKLLLLILVFSISSITCKKSNDEIPESDGRSLTLISTAAEPGQIIFVRANFEPSQDTATIFINSLHVPSTIDDSNIIRFLMPILAPGSKVMMDFRNWGVDKKLEVRIADYKTIESEKVLTETVDAMTAGLVYLNDFSLSTYVRLDPANVEFMKSGIAEFMTRVNSMTAAQKEQLAYTLRQYRYDDASDEPFKVDSSFFISKIQGSAPDPEDGYRQNTFLFLGRTLVGNRDVREGIAIMLLSTQLGLPTGVVIGSVGAYLFLRGIHKLVEAQAIYLNVTLGNAIKRIVEIEFPGKVMADPIKLEKGVSRSIVFSGNFRTHQQGDVTSQEPVMKDFFKARTLLQEGYAASRAIYNTFKKLLPGARELPPVNGQLRETATTKMFPMQGSKLSIRNISSPDIQLKVTNGDTALHLEATSATVTSDTEFSFDLVYTNTGTGTVVIDKVFATYVVPQAGSVSIVSGNNQSALPTYSLRDPLTVLVKDDQGKPIEDVIVQWELVSGGGKILYPTSETNGSGLSTNGWQLGPSGSQRLRAIVKRKDGSNVSGSPVLFSATIVDNDTIAMLVNHGPWTGYEGVDIFGYHLGVWNIFHFPGQCIIGEETMSDSLTITFNSDGTGIYHYWEEYIVRYTPECNDGIPFTRVKRWHRYTFTWQYDPATRQLRGKLWMDPVEDPTTHDDFINEIRSISPGNVHLKGIKVAPYINDIDMKFK